MSVSARVNATLGSVSASSVKVQGCRSSLDWQTVIEQTGYIKRSGFDVLIHQHSELRSPSEQQGYSGPQGGEVSLLNRIYGLSLRHKLQNAVYSLLEGRHEHLKEVCFDYCL
ncbi:hypothetical protein Q8A67_023805 [Cirrhinus molitorella]|uniref:Uncharacterized protein n=1 Tax=Cirrhinus molitorella TaxID=172907 RepID=A0AA88P882_9TELE|nr:hypothetical protein Q8A67_023805 [Cirrhinus molitorella]